MSRLKVDFEPITPAYAAELVQNTLEASGFTNRKLRPQLIAAAEKRFREGRHDPYNSSTIGLATIGGKEVIVNGQHRLAGLARCGSDVKRAVFLVCRGVSPEALVTVDANMGVRTGADALYMATDGEAVDRNVGAAVARRYVAFETEGGWRAKQNLGNLLNIKVDTDLIVDAFREEPQIQLVTNSTRRIFKVDQCPSLSLTAFCWLVLRIRRDISVGMVDDFFERIASGLGMIERVNDWVLRQKMLSLKKEQRGLNRSYYVHCFLRTFRAVNRKERLTSLPVPRGGYYLIKP